MDEIKKLESEEGVPITLQDNNVYTLRAALEAVTGDGLALSELFNLFGPSGGRFCRDCYIRRKDLHQNKIKLEYEMRTISQYNRDLKCNDLSIYGLRESCVFNELKHFHSINNHIFDVLHDLLESTWNKHI